MNIYPLVNTPSLIDEHSRETRDTMTINHLEKNKEHIIRLIVGMSIYRYINVGNLTSIDNIKVLGE